jgi:hypothetical protein
MALKQCVSITHNAVNVNWFIEAKYSKTVVQKFSKNNFKNSSGAWAAALYNFTFSFALSTIHVMHVSAYSSLIKLVRWAFCESSFSKRSKNLILRTRTYIYCVTNFAWRNFQWTWLFASVALHPHPYHQQLYLPCLTWPITVVHSWYLPSFEPQSALIWESALICDYTPTIKH